MSRVSCLRISHADALHARARGFVKAYEAGAEMPETFDALAIDLARYQSAHCAGYARLCAAKNVHIASISRAQEAPAVPTDAFKVARVSTFEPGQAQAIFRTSGTTLGDRGTHELRTTATYDAGALAFGRAALAGDLSQPPAVLILGPPPSEAPDSSLTHMLALFARSLGAPSADQDPWFVRDGVVDLVRLDRRVAALLLQGDAPALVLATSFALVHFLDAIGDDTFHLPAGSRVMQTGGFKGKSREVSASELSARLAHVFAVADAHIVSEYGMTELSSQFYENTLNGGERGVLIEPPWARVIPVHPDTLAPVADGEIGIARIEDLLNVESAFAVQTADRVRRRGAGFELLGRAPGDAPRGCSIGIDELLGGA